VLFLCPAPTPEWGKIQANEKLYRDFSLTPFVVSVKLFNQKKSKRLLGDRQLMFNNKKSLPLGRRRV
jgi:hypothetical protein